MNRSSSLSRRTTLPANPLSAGAQPTNIKQRQRTRNKIWILAILMGLIGAVGVNLSLVVRYLKNQKNILDVVAASKGDNDKPTIPMPPPSSSKNKKENELATIPLPKLEPAQRPNKILEEKEEQSSTEKPVVVAHVVSLIKCSKQAAVTGFLDAAAVLRHSIHQQSVHTGKSKYSYQMVAIVHEQCSHHAHVLDKLGYLSLVKPSPVQLEDIEPGWYRNHVEAENCCGSSEFIKLYAYSLTDYPVTVHWDLDVAVFAPMDDLFDAILFDRATPEGKAARERLDLQHSSIPLPDRIDAFYTKDLTSSQPWEVRQAVQGGFLVARSSPTVLDQYVAFIRKGNYTKGRGNDSGWDGLGYGGFQGAMAYQGVVAYYYDQVAPNTAVELDACQWNQVVADVIHRGPSRLEYKGQCRQYPQPGITHEENTPENGQCYDCRVVTDPKTAHYTACKKPWECAVPHPRNPRDKRHVERLLNLTNITTCGILFKKWFDLRQDYEDLLNEKAGIAPAPRNGGFMPDFFGRYCKASGGYIPMNPPPDNFDSKVLYGV
jgi:hypothetical protein